ncbi:MAG: TatD family hydrolase [bacterium]|nr:TatD family hydrolase [bacterium]
MPKLFDSHTHIHFPIYDHDREEVIKRAREAGVKMLCVGTQAASSQAGVDLAKKYPGEIWAAAGFHPNHFASAWYHDKKEQAESEREKFDASNLLKIAQQPEVVAIGECGLDYYRLPNDKQETTNDKNTQRDAFIAQIKIAEQVGKPLMMHIRPSRGTDDAYLDALDILKSEKFSGGKISHFFVGSLEAAKKMAEAGFSFTFGGVITFARNYDEVIKYLPIENILLETDAPYVAPMPYRGKRNEPAYISATAAKIAELKGLSVEEVAEKTFANALRIFKITL